MNSVFPFSIPVQVALGAAQAVTANASYTSNLSAVDDSIAVLYQDMGPTKAGLYLYFNGMWNAAIPFADLNDFVINGGEVSVYADVQSTVTPPSGADVYRNGVLSSATSITASATTIWATLIVNSGGASSGVTSVGLALPPIFTVSGSPVTASGTLTAALATQTAGEVFAAPAGGGVPVFRALAGTDLPIATAAALGGVKQGTNITIAGDGTISATVPSVPAAANPSASVGTAAVNGSATTFMRSDAAPAISLAIAPTWTGLHTFNGGLTATGAITMTGATNVTVPTVAQTVVDTHAASAAYVKAAVASSSGAPYEVQVPDAGDGTTPTAGQVLWRQVFTAATSFPAGAGSSAFTAAGASGTATINVVKNANTGSPVGTITFTGSGTGVVAMTATSFAAGDNIAFIVAASPTPANIEGIFGTLVGTRT